MESTDDYIENQRDGYAMPPLTPQQDALYQAAVSLFPFTPTLRQSIALDRLSRFVYERSPRKVFVLNGYAGTGKTSLLAAFVRALKQVNYKIVLLAPTGRSAKVFSSFSGLPASTIHRRIYRPVSDGNATHHYTLAPNRLTDTLFVVDEASLIGDAPDLRHSLLQQLIHYVYSSSGCGMVLIGDTAQLPPVGQPRSMAMDEDRLVSLGLKPTIMLLNQPVRQAARSGILFNATLVRHVINGLLKSFKMALRVNRFPADVTKVEGYELQDYYTSSISEVGHEGTIVITRSNWRANAINRDIRYRILDAEEEVGSGERILVTRNNYFWARKSRDALLANGDMATVLWIGPTREHYGLRFADAELLFSGRPDPIAVKLMLSTLDIKAANLNLAEMDVLCARILDGKFGSVEERQRVMDRDPYYNALQIKHAYCITCHKAQGGQWPHVYIDMAGIDPANFGEDFYRWLYTAITRATQRVFFINPTMPTC